MASPTASLRHLHIRAGFTAAPPLSSYSSTLLRLSPSPCCSRAFAFPCFSVSLSTQPHRRASLFPRHFGLRREKKGKMRRNIVVASLFGVGAPEALVIGVVALLVFGPKGLAEVARNLGKTLRAFQPTIRELQDVSREFKSTLEREIGLDDIAASSSSTRNNSPTSVTTNQPSVVDPNGKGAYPSELTQEQLSGSDSTATVEESQDGKRAYSTEDLLKVTEEQLSASASTATADTTTTVDESQVTTPSESTPPAETQVEATAPVWWSSTQTQPSEKSTETKTSEKSTETKQSEKSSE
ncbi:hypothetical protein LUZ60_009386 [Juncus effusus]|nr:hypothetical protein LUZ60_009386 [Juncus effusus]